MRALLATLLLAGCAQPEVCLPGETPGPDPLPAPLPAGAVFFAHAHNDYEHDRPLEDALAQGFHSVEADVYFADGKFNVKHLFYNSAIGTLAGLYLDPLQAKVDANGGSVHGDKLPFTLWVDLKDDDDALPAKLDELLARYPMLSTFGEGGKKGPVTVILTGDAHAKANVVDRPLRHCVRDSNDFTPNDAPADDRWTAYALDWGTYLDSNGDGSLPAEQVQRMNCIVSRAHALGRTVRFYGAPDTVPAWKAQLDAGADYIGADDLAGLAKFLGSR